MFLDIILENPKGFTLFNDKLSLDEINYIIEKKGYIYFVDNIPLKLIDFKLLDDKLFKEYLHKTDFNIYLWKSMVCNIELVNWFKEKFKKIEENSLISNFFMTKVSKVDIYIDDFKDREYIESNIKYLSYVRDLNEYIDIIIKNKDKLGNSNIVSTNNLKTLSEENLLKLLNCDFFEKNYGSLITLYEILIQYNQLNKEIIIENINKLKIFDKLSILFIVKFNVEEVNKMFNNNPSKEGYYLIINNYYLFNKFGNFKFINPIIFEYDTNNVIYVDKELVIDNYEFIKNCILKNGCGKANLKRFLKLNKHQLTEDIIKYGFNKIPLFTSLLLNRPIEKKEKYIQIKNLNLNNLIYSKNTLKEDEKQFIQNNLNLNVNIDFDKLNLFSKNCLENEIKSLRKINFIKE